MSTIRLSLLVVVHNEENQLEDCLKALGFADERVVVLDRCTDGSKAIAGSYAERLLEGAWEREGPRRNAGIEACRGQWIFEVDADERVSEALGQEIRHVVQTSTFDWHEVAVDNYIGDRLVRWGWGGSFGTTAVPRLFRKGAKAWGTQHIHPSLVWHGQKGPRLQHALRHYVDRNISEMIGRLDRYTTAHARDLRENGHPGSLMANVRRMFTRFFKCYVGRRGYREGKWGFLIALFAGFYPLLSYLKATLEPE
jgi:glycosyltransferase involved in cell wall biosynthesis